MAGAPPHPDEEARLAALHRYATLDSASSPGIDRLVRAVAALTGVPIALVSLVDRDRQWFRSCIGLDIDGTPRDQAFCGYTVLAGDPLLIEDALADPRFADNPLVTGAPYIRAYAGVPLLTSDGHALGSLCVIDVVPRSFEASQIAAMVELAPLVVRELDHLLAQDRLDQAVLDRVAAAGRGGSVADVLQAAVDGIGAVAGVIAGGAFVVDGARMHAVGVWHLPPLPGAKLLLRQVEAIAYDLDGDAAGRRMLRGDVQVVPLGTVSSEVADPLRRLGATGLVLVPIVGVGGVRAILGFATSALVGLDDRLLERLRRVADAVASAMDLIAERERHGRTSDLLADLLRQRRRLSELAAVREGLITSVSHEVRTPLTVICGAAAVLAERDPSPVQASELASAIVRHADRLRSLLDGFFAVSQVPVEVDRALLPAVEVRALVEEGVSVGTEGRDDPGSIRLVAGDHVVTVDPATLVGVVGALVDNAVRHTPDGTSIVVSAEVQRDDLLVVVTDDGPGIPPELHATVLDPLVQGPLLETHAPGVGMGLALVAAVAGSYRGEVWIDTADTGGAAVYVRFPSVVPDADRAVAG